MGYYSFPNAQRGSCGLCVEKRLKGAGDVASPTAHVEKVKEEWTKVQLHGFDIWAAVM